MRTVFTALTKRRLLLFGLPERAEVVAFVDSHINDIAKQVRPYPGPRPGSRYLRTGTLYNSWVVHTEAGTSQIAGSITIQAPYAKFVQGLEQVWFHRETGWKRLQDYVDRARYRADLLGLIQGIRLRQG